MRVGRWMAEDRINAILQLFGERVLQPICLHMQLFPRHAKPLLEIYLKEPVMAQDLTRHFPACLGQGNALIRTVRHKAALSEIPDHIGCRGGGESEPVGERNDTEALAAVLLFQMVDSLEVVLLGLRRLQRCHRVRHTRVVAGTRRCTTVL